MNAGDEPRGQALVESALALLLASVVVAASFRAVLSVLHKGVGESVALQEAIRQGRGMPPLADPVRRRVFGEAPVVEVRRATGDVAPLGIPLPVRLAGRSEASVSTRWPDEALAVPGDPRGAPPASRSAAALSCDPWDSKAPSGKRIGRVVRALVATGWLQ